MVIDCLPFFFSSLTKNTEESSKIKKDLLHEENHYEKYGSENFCLDTDMCCHMSDFVYLLRSAEWRSRDYGLGECGGNGKAYRDAYGGGYGSSDRSSY
jgi:hypothetical protein